MSVKDVICKFKDFINNIFVKKRPMLNSSNNSSEEMNNDRNQQNAGKTNSIKEMGIQNKKDRALEDIIEITEKNPELLNSLDLEKLEVINQYYIENTKKVRERNTKLKKEIRILQERLEGLNKIVENM